MAFQSPLSFNNPPQSFSVRNPVNSVKINRAQPLVTRRVAPQNLGNVASAVPVSALVDNMFVVAPTGASINAPGVVFTLPSATNILAVFGEELGVSKLAAGDQLIFSVNNKGTSPAYVASNSSGGDGSAVIALPNGNTGAYSGQGTGTLTNVGHVTQFVLEWLQVNSGSNGATGLYAVYY